MKKPILLVLSYFIFLIIFFVNISFAEDFYRFRTMGQLNNQTINLPDKSIFNMFKAEGAFTDSDGNYGDLSARGVRETDSEGKLIKINVLLIFEAIDGSKLYAKPNRINSELGSGAGYFDILFASGKFQKLLGLQCNYGTTITEKEAFIMEGICK